MSVTLTGLVRQPSHTVSHSPPPPLLVGSFADGEPDGQTRGGAGGGERPGRGGQGVHEGHGRH